MTCLITGCSLSADGLFYHGDLHRIGESYVFNAVIDRAGDTVPNTSPTDPRVIVAQEWFVRRGLFVIPKGAAELNAEATSFLDRWSKP